ncbi:ATP-dependent RNA helicase SUV3 homolog, mitochondrial [Agrilus planipennis]|uniref:ATP-dependent RNA helicase SUV3 homolog, mitochondrial n=1 Tax=Agrilus planipennis TaxID=224129 RepID=A0A1W4W8F5_AGRPL|nr:ATP-dependent RNA helicase SUV3 homolog, mitochondrial [Agrilus planipennis]
MSMSMKCLLKNLSNLKSFDVSNLYILKFCRFFLLGKTYYNAVEITKIKMLTSPRRIAFTFFSISNLKRRFKTKETCITTFPLIQQRRGKKDDSNSISTLFKPVPVKSNPDDINVGVELTGSLNKSGLLRVLNTFYQQREVKQLLTENGLDHYIQHQSYVSFRRYCLDAKTLPVDLHIVISDILQGAGHVTDIFPYFLRHAKEMFPHLECLDDLKKISDLRDPANWYPQARALNRKIIFHAGPTNSGKTYHALERLMTAKSGVYCGPLKLLANEVFNKCNGRGTSCDLITGEERNYADPSGNQSPHVSCTVEMSSVNTPYEVAVIDEIQMIRDLSRGWAWTRAFLGIIAEEVHLCGEVGATDLIQKICLTTGEDVEIRRYKRLTDLTVENTALGSLENIQPGDCIVCFSKNDIYSVSRAIEASGKEVAVIYGGLPPGTKLAQAAKFNDPQSSCKVLVATDAIGMGLNLSIRRVIFYSLIKPTLNEKGEKEMDVISVSQALQIAGRAGRYGTQWEQGFVTTFKPEDLNTLKSLLNSEPESITQAGLHPTAEQIELYAYHLPNATLSNLMDIFINLSTVDDSLYFMCNIEDFKFLADMIQHVPLPLRARYVFCCAPINKKMPFVCTMFLKFARQYSKNESITFDWLCRNIGWPLQTPKTIIDLVHLEAVFDVLDLYLWLSYRFMDLFPDAHLVRDIQSELDSIIQQGVLQITRLLRNSETGIRSATGAALDEDEFEINKQRQNYLRSAKSSSVGRGKLTERLLAQGLLTPKMLQELKKEWGDQHFTSDDNEEPPPRPVKRKPRHKR